jgi:hypothetical protein
MLINLFKIFFYFGKNIINIVLGNLFPVLTNPSTYFSPESSGEIFFDFVR